MVITRLRFCRKNCVAWKSFRFSVFIDDVFCEGTSFGIKQQTWDPFHFCCSSQQPSAFTTEQMPSGITYVKYIRFFANQNVLKCARKNTSLSAGSTRLRVSRKLSETCAFLKLQSAKGKSGEKRWLLSPRGNAEPCPVLSFALWNTNQFVDQTGRLIRIFASLKLRLAMRRMRALNCGW